MYAGQLSPTGLLLQRHGDTGRAVRRVDPSDHHDELRRRCQRTSVFVLPEAFRRPNEKPKRLQYPRDVLRLARVHALRHGPGPASRTARNGGPLHLAQEAGVVVEECQLQPVKGRDLRPARNPPQVGPGEARRRAGVPGSFSADRWQHGVQSAPRPQVHVRSIDADTAVHESAHVAVHTGLPIETGVRHTPVSNG